jgi:endonuclease/exonuclease/phosphatase family metal-dependent hydrolase
VATFNVLFGLDSNADTNAEYNSTKAVLARLDADIVAFQELKVATESRWQQMGAELGYRHVQMVRTNDSRAGNLFLGYFSRFPIQSLFSVNPPAPDTNGVIHTNEMARLPLRGVFRVPGAARPLVIWNQHKKSGGTEGDQFRRAIEAYRVVQDINAYVGANPSHNEFLTVGDFNQDYRSTHTTFFYSQPSGLVSSYRLGADIAALLTAGQPVAYSIFPNERYANAGGGLHRLPAYQQGGTNEATYPSSGYCLDYILASTALRDSPLGAPATEVYNSQRDLASGGAGLPKAGAVLPASTSTNASDHLPVLADLNMADAPQAQFDVSSGSFVSTRLMGSQYTVQQKTYRLTNNKSGTLKWFLAAGVGWLDFNVGNGSVASGGQADITVSLNSRALDLPDGQYFDQLLFTDEDTGSVVVRDVVLRVANQQFIVSSPAAVSSTISNSFVFEGAMHTNLVGGLSWSNRANGLTGTVPYSIQWSASIPMGIGTNIVDFRGSYAVTNLSNRATDSPSDPAYASGWFSQSNGGQGFGSWALRSDWGFAGHLLFGPGVFNVPTNYGGAFSLWASGNGVTTARRDFSRTLTTNDTFRLQFDNNWIDWTKSVGFALADSSGAKRLDFFFVGGESNYRVADASGVRVTQIGYTDQGQDISVQFTTNNGYLLTTGTNVITGTLASGGDISSLIASNNGSGVGTEFDMYLGGMSVEDSSGVWASDHPTNSAYGGVWTNGSQAGIGFAPWQVASVAPNGWAGQARFGTNVSNVTPAFGGAFSLWASGGGYSEARRAFPQAMTNGETFVLQFDNNLVEQGKLVGFSLADASGTDRVTFLCYGGQQVYWVADAADARATTIPMTQSGLEVRVALTGSNTYRLSAGANVVEGTLAGGGAIGQLRAFNYGSGPATDYDFYLGGMRIETPVVSSQEVSATAMQVVRQIDPAALTDGLPNSWWIQHFGTIEGVSAASDSDGDGFSNVQEHSLGTDPKNFASALRTDPPSVLSGQVTIRWDAVQGKTYRVIGTTNLATTTWLTLEDNITAPVTGKQTWTHSTGSPQHFYRVELVQ